MTDAKRVIEHAFLDRPAFIPVSRATALALLEEVHFCPSSDLQFYGSGKVIGRIFGTTIIVENER